MRKSIKFLMLGVAGLLMAGQSALAQDHAKTVQTQPYVQPSSPTLGISAVPASNGLEVVDVYGNTPANRLGLEAGDRIIQINGRSIRCVQDLQAALRHAVAYHGGAIRVLIDNVRGRAGWPGEPRFVSRSTYLDGYYSAGYTPNPVPVPVYTSGQ